MQNCTGPFGRGFCLLSSPRGSRGSEDEGVGTTQENPSTTRTFKLRNPKNRKGKGLRSVQNFLGPFPENSVLVLKNVFPSFVKQFFEEVWSFWTDWSMLLNRISSMWFQGGEPPNNLAELQVHGSFKWTTELSTKLGDRKWWSWSVWGCETLVRAQMELWFCAKKNHCSCWNKLWKKIWRAKIMCCRVFWNHEVGRSSGVWNSYTRSSGYFW